MSISEFSRMVSLGAVSQAPLKLKADKAERAALARRFDIVAIDSLVAHLQLEADGQAVSAEGTLEADVVQNCAVAGDDFPTRIRETLSMRFVPATNTPATPDEEIELEADELDEIPYEGDSFDLGEAIAQSLALAIDPYAEGPNADTARREHGLIEEGSSGPLADALRALKGD